ncbi:phosphonopyruvate decarboxylase [Actinacidiphila acidipaludis]|uniref:Phosphonopyruvate decarboxylase n=1 Tax=Actinacidiphila acidipaludis TaxID=2873382 RepID=A0ABS7QE34_9ACTN|nr:phosphonopyruvate decarboxylase [Streptomyces acidipaludis]MBY8881440.1 phosphonopyruvate decarboxylase [Streptomyces acidipaludis]
MSSVPCSFFAAPLRLLDGDPRFRHVPGVNEGSSLAVAAGALLGGERAAVIAQNSGFGNMINPLTSLVLPYRIPVLVFMSMRGWPAIASGEEQHEWMGKVSADWLGSLGIATHWLTGDESEQVETLQRALDGTRRGDPAFVLVPKGTFPPPDTPAGAASARDDASPGVPRGVTREQLVDAVTASDTDGGGDQVVLSTTGYMSRALFAGGDRPGNFYMQGSMGHVASLSLGVALSRPDRRVVVLDGDGAVLMHMGVLATIGAHHPRNLVHVVFDNGAYGSTGGQPVGVRVDFAAAAAAAGYRHTHQADDVASVREALAATRTRPGPHLLVARGVESAGVGSRASDAIAPDRMAGRFTRHVSG